MLVFKQYIKNYHEIFQHNLIISMEIYTYNAHTHTHVIILTGHVMQPSILQSLTNRVLAILHFKHIPSPLHAGNMSKILFRGLHLRTILEIQINHLMTKTASPFYNAPIAQSTRSSLLYRPELPSLTD